MAWGPPTNACSGRGRGDCRLPATAATGHTWCWGTKPAQAQTRSQEAPLPTARHEASSRCVPAPFVCPYCARALVCICSSGCVLIPTVHTHSCVHGPTPCTVWRDLRRCTHARSTHTTHRVPHAPCTHTRAHELTHTLPCSRRRHAGHRLILQPGWDPGTKVPSKSRKALARGWGFPSGPKAAAGRPGQGPARRSFKGAGAARGAGTPVGPFPALPEARESDSAAG